MKENIEGTEIISNIKMQNYKSKIKDTLIPDSLVGTNLFVHG